MYRCVICRDVSPPRQSRLLHVVSQPIEPVGSRIVQELPVCRRCKDALLIGQPLADLLRACQAAAAEESTQERPTNGVAKVQAVEINRSEPKPVVM